MSKRFMRCVFGFIAVIVAMTILSLPSVVMAAEDDAGLAGYGEAGDLLEPLSGDGPADAQAIELNTYVEDKLKNEQVKWYRITLPSRGWMQILFENEYHETNSWRIRVYRESDLSDLYVSDTVYSHTLVPTKLRKIPLNSGTYYIRVFDDYNSSGGIDVAYRMKVLYESDPTWEAEPNDEPSIPNDIVMGRTYHGNDKYFNRSYFLNNPGYRDWYRFDLDERSSLTLRFGSDHDDESTKGSFKICFLKKSDVGKTDGRIGRYSMDNLVDEDFDLGYLDPDTYYVNIEGDSSPRSSYHFSITKGSGDDTSEMYRLYNPNSGEHFYTADADERDHLASIGWDYEGVGWIAPIQGDPVYRLYNANGGEHHYTLSSNERDTLVKAGWKYEGVGWYSDQHWTVPLMREYNPNKHACNHNYTTSESEHEHLVSIGWLDEGIAWYGAAAG